MTGGGRSLDDHLGDLAEAVDAAAEIVALGKERWDAERPLRLAGEAVVGRLGDVATQLPERVLVGTSEVPWTEVKGIRIVVDHAAHRIDHERVWRTLSHDVPQLGRAVGRWVERHHARDVVPALARERDGGRSHGGRSPGSGSGSAAGLGRGLGR